MVYTPKRSRYQFFPAPTHDGRTLFPGCTVWYVLITMHLTDRVRSAHGQHKQKRLCCCNIPLIAVYSSCDPAPRIADRLYLRISSSRGPRPSEARLCSCPAVDEGRELVQWAGERVFVAWNSDHHRRRCCCCFRCGHFPLFRNLVEGGKGLGNAQQQFHVVPVASVRASMVGCGRGQGTSAAYVTTLAAASDKWTAPAVAATPVPAFILATGDGNEKAVGRLDISSADSGMTSGIDCEGVPATTIGVPVHQICTRSMPLFSELNADKRRCSFRVGVCTVGYAGSPEIPLRLFLYFFLCHLAAAMFLSFVLREARPSERPVRVMSARAPEERWRRCGAPRRGRRGR